MLIKIFDYAKDWLGVLPIQFEFLYAIFGVLFVVAFITIVCSPFIIALKLTR